MGRRRNCSKWGHCKQQFFGTISRHCWYALILISVLPILHWDLLTHARVVHTRYANHTNSYEKSCDNVSTVNMPIDVVLDITAGEWKSLGGEFHILWNRIEVVDFDRYTMERKRQAVLRAWYEDREEAYWEEIIESLKRMEQRRLANRMAACKGRRYVKVSRERHASDDSTSPSQVHTATSNGGHGHSNHSTSRKPPSHDNKDGHDSKSPRQKDVPTRDSKTPRQDVPTQDSKTPRQGDVQTQDSKTPRLVLNQQENGLMRNHPSLHINVVPAELPQNQQNDLQQDVCSFSLFFLRILLLLGGDIERNPGPESILTMVDLPELMKKLTEVAGNWNLLGVQLNFTPGTLRGFPLAVQLDPKQALQELLRCWLERTSPSPTLEALAEAIRSPVIGNELLARTLLEQRGDFPSIPARESEMAEGGVTSPPRMKPRVPRRRNVLQRRPILNPEQATMKKALVDSFRGVSSNIVTEVHIRNARECIKHGGRALARYELVQFTNILEQNQHKGDHLGMMATAYDLLLKYVMNLIRPQCAQAWRSIKTTKSVFRCIDCMEGGRDILRMIGYSEVTQTSMELPEDVEEPDRERLIIIAAELLMANLEVEQMNATQQAPPQSDIQHHQESIRSCTVAENTDYSNTHPLNRAASASESESPTLRVLSHLPVADCWYRVGLELGVSQYDLDVIAKNYPQDHEKCKLEMFGKWLRGDPNSTYEKLVKALTALGKGSIAEDVCAKQGIQPVGAKESSSPLPECIQRYTKYLKEKYQAFKPLYSEWPPTCGRSYVELTLIERKEKLPNIDERTQHDYIRGVKKTVEEEQEVQIQDILTSAENCPLRVLLDGAPGSGKSTLCRKICKDWANGETLQEYDLVVLVPLREAQIRKATLTELITPWFYTDSPSLRKQIVKHILETSGENVLLILDGYDELAYKERTDPSESPFPDIIRGEKLRKCSILVTSRPYASDYLLENELIGRYVEVLGFSEDQVESILASLPDHPELAINALCSTPLHCAILMWVYQQDHGKLPKTLTELFRLFVIHALKRHAKALKYDPKTVKEIDNLEKLPNFLHVPFQHLCKMAYSGLVQYKMVFHYKDLPQIASPDSDLDNNLLSLMTAVKSYSGSSEHMNYQFLHLSIQEFLAAHWAATNLSPMDQYSFVAENVRDSWFRMVILFFAGISQLKNQTLTRVFRQRLSLPSSHLREQQPRGVTEPNTVFVSGPDFIHYRQFSTAPCYGNQVQPALRSGVITGSRQIQLFLFLGQMIYESSASPLYYTLCDALSNCDDLCLYSYRLTSLECAVLSQFLLAVASKYSWRLLDLHFCGLTNHSLEAFDKVCSESPHKEDVHIDSLDLSYNNASLITKLSLLPTMLLFKHTRKLVLEGIHYPEGVPPEQIELHSVLSMENLRDLTISVVKVPDCHTSDYIEVFQKFLETLKGNHTLNMLLYQLWPSVDRSSYRRGYIRQGRYPQLETSRDFFNGVCMSGVCHLFQIAASEPILTTLNVSHHVSRIDTCSKCMVTSESVLKSLDSMLQPNATVSKLLLRECQLPSPAVDCITDGLARNCSLKVLDISNNELASHALEAIMESLKKNTTLEEINLSGNNLSGSCTLKEMLSENRTLKVLKLHHCGLDDAVAKHIAAGLAVNTSLESLDLSGNSINITGIVRILQTLEHHKVPLKLDLCYNVGPQPLDEETTAALCYLLKDARNVLLTKTQLQTIAVSFLSLGKLVINYTEDLPSSKVYLKEDVTADVCVRFFRALNQSHVEHHLSVSGLKYQTVEPFVVALAESMSVKVLDFSNVNDIDSSGAVSIFTSLQRNTSLEELDLSGNSHLTKGDSEAVGCAIERMLTENRTLKVLNLSHCGLDDTVAKHIAAGLAVNTSLESLDLSGNNINITGIVRILQALERHEIQLNLFLSDHYLSLSDQSPHPMDEETTAALCYLLKDAGNVLLTKTQLQTIDVSFLNLGKLVIDYKDLPSIKLHLHLATAVKADVCVRFFRALNQSHMAHHLSVGGLMYQTVEPFTVGLAESMSVKVLDFFNFNEINSSGAASIFTWLQHNTSLKELNLSGNIHLTEGGSEAVGRAIERMLTVNRTLKVLNLSHCGLDVVAKHIAAGLIHNNCIAKLNISWTRPTPEGCVHLFTSLHQNLSLKKLDIRYNKLGLEGSVALATCLTHNTSIADLHIGNTRLTPEACVNLFRSLHQNLSLKKLNISGNKLGMEGSVALASFLTHNTSIAKLNIRHTEPTPEGCVQLFRSLHQNLSLKKLDISHNKLGMEGSVALATCLTHNTSIVDLNIRHTEPTPEGCVQLFRSLHQNLSLKKLDISHNKLGMEGSVALTTCLTHNTSIAELHINFTILTPEACVHLFKSLCQNSSLKKLDISDNKLGMKGSEALAEMLSYNKSLTELNITDCGSGGPSYSKPFTEPEIRVIARGLLQNTTLETLKVCYKDKEHLENEIKRLQASGQIGTSSKRNLKIVVEL